MIVSRRPARQNVLESLGKSMDVELAVDAAVEFLVICGSATLILRRCGNRQHHPAHPWTTPDVLRSSVRLLLEVASPGELALCPAERNKWRTNMTMSTAPKVQTMVAPVGRSSSTEKYTPRAETNVPMVHPMANRRPIRSAKSMAPTEGTIR